ncbi:Fusaric acid resistance protein-like [Microbacterium sp. LKL04]|uniref:FUSC family protein n=1 Tax=Microbacterium sp. LKL04 TaxID=912630 RepID=UPI000875C2BB|nr:FUSC family protein [Microbacterium sp. LKL04]SCY60170.1 Fusaric acid resistance protein-like [Microbacterium sp. LKL04]
MSASRGRIWTGVIRVAPYDRDHTVAIRAAISVGVPLLFLWTMGRLDLSIYASFGAFASLYGRTDRIGDRVRMQAAAGAVLLTAMLIGTATSVAGLAAPWAIVVVSAVASLVTLLAYSAQWHPPGALFIVFAAGATASVPADVTRLMDVLAVGLAAVIFSIIITFVYEAVSARSIPRLTRTKNRIAVGAVAAEMAITVAVATLLGGIAGLLLLDSHWYWAMVGAVAAVSGPHVKARIIRGLQRLIGTGLGVVVAAAILALGVPPLGVILIAVALQAAAELFVGRNYAIAMVFITPLALLMVQLAAPTTAGVLLSDRLGETLVGIVAGTAVAVVSALVRRTR